MTKRVLLCDDDYHILHAAEIKFRRAEFEVQTAGDGEEAWQIMQTWQPDVLVTDCQMPRLGGIGLAGRCREHEATREMPILMLTARGLELSGDEMREQFGVLAVLHKPFSPRELLRCVEQIIETGTCTPPKLYA